MLPLQHDKKQHAQRPDTACTAAWLACRWLTEVRLGQAMWTSARAWKPCQQMALKDLEARCICFNFELAPAPRLHVSSDGHRSSTCKHVCRVFQCAQTHMQIAKLMS